MNCLSEHFSNFRICCWSISLFSSFPTLSWRWVGIRRPFCWIGVTSGMNCVFPILKYRFAKFSSTHCLISEFDVFSSVILSICLCCGFSWIIFIPILGSRLRPRIIAFWSSTSRNGSDWIVYRRIPSLELIVRSWLVAYFCNVFVDFLLNHKVRWGSLVVLFGGRIFLIYEFKIY